MLPASRQVKIKVNDREVVIASAVDDSIDYVAREVFVNNEYPPIPWLQTRATTVVDVGANVGCASIWFHLNYPNARIFALEPNQKTFHYLQQNLRQVTDAKLFCCGLYDRGLDAELFSGRGTSVTNSIGKSILNSGESITARLVRASDFLKEQNLERVSILKIDTEGAEVPIVRDIEAWLEKIDAIYLEYHSESDRRELDHLLAPNFCLFSSNAKAPHRGNVVYVSSAILKENPAYNRFAIDRPRL